MGPSIPGRRAGGQDEPQEYDPNPPLNLFHRKTPPLQPGTFHTLQAPINTKNPINHTFFKAQAPRNLVHPHPF